MMEFYFYWRMRSSSGLMLLLFCSLTAVNSQPGRWRVGRTWSGAPGSCARCVAQMGSPMTTTAASVPTTCEYWTGSPLEWQAMGSAPDGFSLVTTYLCSSFNLLKPSSPGFCSMMLFLLLGGVWESQLNLRALWGLWGERLAVTLVFGQNKDWK